LGTDLQEKSSATSNRASRIDRVFDQIEFCLRELRRTDHAGRLSGDLALIWRLRLGPLERVFLLIVAAQAAESEHPEDLGCVLGRRRWRP
jgi:hypothetical protein